MGSGHGFRLAGPVQRLPWLPEWVGWCGLMWWCGRKPTVVSCGLASWWLLVLTLLLLPLLLKWRLFPPWEVLPSTKCKHFGGLAAAL